MKKMSLKKCFVLFVFNITVRLKENIFFWKQMLVSFGVDFRTLNTTLPCTQEMGNFLQGPASGLAALEARQGHPLDLPCFPLLCRKDSFLDKAPN